MTSDPDTLGPPPDDPSNLATELTQRVLGDREYHYLREVQRILDATYAIIERQDNLNPSLREILRETNLSSHVFYRYFRSKDDLLYAIFREGCQRLMTYLNHRMAGVTSPEDQIRQWVTGMLVQAAYPAVAARTRPFVEDQFRLRKLFPEETRVSMDALSGLLVPAVEQLSGLSNAESKVRAQAIYQLTYGSLSDLLVERRTPTTEQIEVLVDFVVRAVRSSSSMESTHLGSTGDSQVKPANPSSGAR
jgi:AcrR family transcriptional regulator